MDEIAPQLKGKAVASIKIGFKKNEDETGMRVMYSPARWVHELYPVDEALAKELKIPLEKIELDEFEGGPTYRVQAYDAAGKELLSREFTVTTAMQPYNGVIKPYEQVQVDTGWVRIEAASTRDSRSAHQDRHRGILGSLSERDAAENFSARHVAVARRAAAGVRADLRHAQNRHSYERAGLQPGHRQGTYFVARSASGRHVLLDRKFRQHDRRYGSRAPVTYVGRIIPIVHAPDDGKDGHVHIEFYAKPAANPMVELSWTDAQGKHHERKRNLYALTGAMQPRLIEARADCGRSAKSYLAASGGFQRRQV